MNWVHRASMFLLVEQSTESLRVTPLPDLTGLEVWEHSNTDILLCNTSVKCLWKHSYWTTVFFLRQQSCLQRASFHLYGTVSHGPLSSSSRLAWFHYHRPALSLIKEREKRMRRSSVWPPRFLHEEGSVLVMLWMTGVNSSGFFIYSSEEDTLPCIQSIPLFNYCFWEKILLKPN